jgi:hypothetical protein
VMHTSHGDHLKCCREIPYAECRPRLIGARGSEPYGHVCVRGYRKGGTVLEVIPCAIAVAFFSLYRFTMHTSKQCE